jgi:Cys-tRNA(Pro)/Cys-tRNA(Cys) deacylase
VVDEASAVVDDAPGVRALRERGIEHRIIHPGHVTSVEEAAQACGVRPDQVVKTLVVRRADDDYVLVLVPGNRSLSWPKLRTLLGVNRISLPDADEALAATGYARGTISPLGLDLPVIADASLVAQQITLGTGQRDTVVALDADAVIDAYDAVVADVTTDPASR